MQALCQKQLDSPECLEVAQTLKETLKQTKEKPEDYLLRCTDDEPYWEKVRTNFDWLTGCGLGGYEAVADPLVSAGTFLGQTAAKATLAAEASQANEKLCNSSVDNKRRFFALYNLTLPEILKIPIPSEKILNSKTCNELLQFHFIPQENQKYQSTLAKIRGKESQHQVLSPAELEFAKRFLHKGETGTGTAGLSATGLGEGLLNLTTDYLHQKKIDISCYNTKYAMAALCEGLADLVGIGAGVKVAGEGLINLAGRAGVAKKIGVVGQSSGELKLLTEAAQAESTFTRQELIKRFAFRETTTELQNRKWLTLAEQPARPGERLFFCEENSVLKNLNDTLQDKSLVTALNHYRQSLLDFKLNKLIKDYPDLKFTPYSDYKSYQIAIEGKPLPPGLNKRLSDLFQNVNEEFTQTMRSQKIVRDGDHPGALREGDRPEKWFRSGTGDTADQANLTARYSRQVEGSNQLQTFSNSEVREALQKNWETVEVERQNLERQLNGSQALETIPGTTKKIPSEEVFAVIRKESDPTKASQELSQKVGTTVTPDQAKLLIQYTKSVDAFSPGLRVAKRKIASLNDAEHGGLSSDFVGLGAENLKATAAGLAKGQQFEKSLEEVRTGERSVSATLAKRMRAQESTIRNLLVDRHGLKDLEVICSGDDCIVQLPRALDLRQKKQLVQQLSRSDNPAGIRLSMVGDQIASPLERNLLATHGESLEKGLRKALSGVIPEDKLKKIMFAVDMQGQQMGQGKVRLFIGNSREKLTPNESERIHKAFAETVEKFNASLKTESEPAGNYLPDQTVHALIDGSSFVAKLHPRGSQGLAILRMRNLNQRLRSLSQRLAVKVSNPVLRDNIVNIRPRGHDARAWTQFGHNAWLFVARATGQGDDWLAALTKSRTTNEINLTTYARYQTMPDRVGTDLACQIHFHRRIDCDHFRIASNDGRRVDVIAGIELNRRVVVHKIIELACSQNESRQRLSGMDTFT